MSRRIAKPRPEFNFNGWIIRKLPNSFAEQYVWEAVALTADGYQAARHGFQRKGEATAFALANVPPSTRAGSAGA